MAERVRDQELQRAERLLARGDEPQQVLAQLARGITNKLIHAPTAGLKQASAAGRRDVLAQGRKLLGLEDTPALTINTAAQESPELEFPSSSNESTEHTERTLQ